MTDLVQEQIEYYAARAEEYDDWFYRAGRYDRGAEPTRRWLDEVAQLRHALLLTGPCARALELACGTGLWTHELATLADHLTAVDASREMIRLNRARLKSDPGVHYERANVFEWTPQDDFDLVFMGFWLSHVPPDRFEGFMRMVHGALHPGGRLFMIDSLREATSTAQDHRLEPPDSIQQTRTLEDGRQYTVVKVFYETDDLQQRLTAAGFDAAVRQTGTYFWYADAVKR